MKKLLFIIIIVAGFLQWKKTHQPLSLHDENGNPNIVLFTAPECGDPCTQMTQALNKRKLPYTEKIVDIANNDDENTQAWLDYGRNTLPLLAAGSDTLYGYEQSRLIETLTKNFDDEYLLPNERRYYKKHFDAQGKPLIVLYGTDWCPGCKQLRQELDDAGLDFVDIDVEKSVYFEDMVKTMQIPGYPAVWVGYKRVQGTTLSAVKSAL